METTTPFGIVPTMRAFGPSLRLSGVPVGSITRQVSADVGVEIAQQKIAKMKKVPFIQLLLRQVVRRDYSRLSAICHYDSKDIWHVALERCPPIPGRRLDRAGDRLSGGPGGPVLRGA